MNWLMVLSYLMLFVVLFVLSMTRRCSSQSGALFLMGSIVKYYKW